MPVSKAPYEAGLALGGGAARGLAHIGVLKVLAEAAVKIRCVAGTSVGAVVGAAFCAGYSWAEILAKARAIDWTDVAVLTFPRMGLMSLSRLERLLDRLFGSKSFDELDIPFSAVAVDLVSGDEVVIQSGPVAQAVRASCSIPGIFEPALCAGRTLVDGGLRNDVPADVAKAMGAGTVIGVDLNSVSAHARAPRSILDVIHYSYDILMQNATQAGLSAADIVISPDMKDVGYQELGRIDELVERGESAARAALIETKIQT